LLRELSPIRPVPDYPTVRGRQHEIYHQPRARHRGNDIYVSVQADNGKSIASVRTELDGLELATDELSAPSDFYEPTFSRAGTAGPHTEHSLIVTAELTDGAVHSSTSIWADPI